MQNLVVVSHTVCTHVGAIWRMLGPHPLWTVAWLTPRNTLLPGLTCVAMPNSVMLRSNYMNVIMEIRQKILTRRVPPFKVTR